MNNCTRRLFGRLSYAYSSTGSGSGLRAKLCSTSIQRRPKSTSSSLTNTNNIFEEKTKLELHDINKVISTSSSSPSLLAHGQNRYHYKGHCSKLYAIGPACNGGYVAAMATSAAKNGLSSLLGPSNGLDVLSVQSSFQQMVEHDNCDRGKETDFIVEIAHTARSSATVNVFVYQDEDGENGDNISPNLSSKQKLRCCFMIYFGNLSKITGINYRHPNPSIPHGLPALPPRNECIHINPQVLAKMPGLDIMKAFDLAVPESDPYLNTTLQGNSGLDKEASLSGYVKMVGGGANFEFICDALPPPSLNVMMTNWVPTLTYDISLFDSPQNWVDKDVWVRCSFRTELINSGLLVTDGELWSEDGSTFLARSRQLARHLIPRK